MNNNVSIGIVLYYPDEGFIQRLKVISSFGFHIYIYDNGVNENVKLELKELSNNSKLDILGKGENLGLGNAINELNKYAINDGHDFLIFFDQDTIVNHDFKDSVLNINFLELMNTTYTALQIISEGDIRFVKHVGIIDVLFNINSGSIFNLNLVSEIDFHDPSFFVEGVDYEFCLRSRAKGFRVGILTGLYGLDHFSNQDGKVISVLGKSVRIRVYPPSRVKDLNKSHFKLIFTAFKLRDLNSLFTLLKFLFVFNFKNLSSIFLNFIRSSK